MTQEVIGEAAFEALMLPLGPFERPPKLAVAVSGGPDSTALAVLVQRWAAARGGAVVALIVDHGLRPESAAEARATAAAMDRLGLSPQVLRWRGEKPQRGIQEQARLARQALFDQAMRKHRILHLLLAHHRDDQAETLLLRLARGSGPGGLAAMPAIVERPWYRVLRPLLPVPKASLTASLRAWDRAWIEDPANQDPRFARARLRRLAPLLSAEGLDGAGLEASLQRLREQRDLLEHDLAHALAGCVGLDPRGWAVVGRDRFAALPRARALQVLERLLLTIGGGCYAPRRARVETAWQRLQAPDFTGATLGGCRLLRHQDRLLLLRETGRSRAAGLVPGQSAFWDGRFEITLGRRPGPHRGPLRARCLGSAGWRAVRAAVAEAPRPPAPLCQALASLWDDDGPIAVPGLAWRRPGWTEAALGRWRFRPRNLPTHGAFTVV